MINADWLSSYVVFAEELNFTRAAARLHLSQPALYVQVRKLGDALEVELYARRGRSLALTPQGIHVLAFARELRDRTNAFLSGLGRPTPQAVVLAAGEGTLLYALSGAIRDVAATRDVRLRVLTRDRDGILRALESGETHLGVLPLEVVPDWLDATALRKVGMKVVMPAGHRLARKRRLRLVDLAGERLIVPPPERPHRQLVARALASAGVAWELAVEASGWEVMLTFAKLGVGLAIVNDICSVPRGAVARSLHELPSLDYYVAQRVGRTLEAPAALLRQRVITAFRGLRPTSHRA
jgi:DNA-binding transcriptional LysR family regulator